MLVVLGTSTGFFWARYGRPDAIVPGKAGSGDWTLSPLITPFAETKTLDVPYQALSPFPTEGQMISSTNSTMTSNIYVCRPGVLVRNSNPYTKSKVCVSWII